LPQLQRPFIRSITHAPDQPTCRPRLLHWTFDLPASGDGECGKGATDFHDLSRAPSEAQVEIAQRESHLRVREAILASLGNWTAIENKDASRLWCSFRITKTPTKSTPPFKSCFNAAEMRQNFLNFLGRDSQRFKLALTLREIAKPLSTPLKFPFSAVSETECLCEKNQNETAGTGSGGASG
jgi:hypothetical protein